MLAVFLRGLLIGSLGLTLTNPSTILSFVAIFAGLGLGGGGSDGARARRERYEGG